MSNIQQIEEVIVNIEGLSVIIDSDIAKLYGVNTRDINKAVKNNPDKFPEEYIIVLTKKEKNELVEKFHRFEKIKHSAVEPKAFSEKGLYMLATILRSKIATETTISIIETFAKIRSLSRTISDLSKESGEAEQKKLMRKSGNIISELLDNSLQTDETETTIELNFAVLKLKHKVKRKK